MNHEDESSSGTSIDWVAATHSSAFSCPTCKASSSTSILEVNARLPEFRRLHVNRCDHCATSFYTDDDPVVGYSDGLDDNYWKHYVEIGAGIDAMMAFAMCIPHAPNPSFLEIGCGFGFIVDFWGRNYNNRAVGLEKAHYGKIGRELLGAEIHHEYLSDCAAIKDEKFDVVFSCEVIEHTTDPAAFISDIKTAVADDGILILTTPASEYLSPTHNKAALLAALSPGFHYFLLSKSALESLLRNAGFEYVNVVITEERLVAAASNRPIPDIRITKPSFETYSNYLGILSRSTNSHLAGGALYRLFKECVNKGLFHEATGQLHKLRELAREYYRINIDDPPVTEILQSTEFQYYKEKYPFWLGPLMYYMGIYNANHLNDQRSALRHFESATRILRHESTNWVQFAQEAASLIQTADYHFRRAACFVLQRETPLQLGISVAENEPVPSRILIDRFTYDATNLLKDMSDFVYKARPQNIFTPIKRILKLIFDRIY